MVQFEELLLKLQALKPEIDDLSDALGMKGMLSEIQQLELKQPSRDLGRCGKITKGFTAYGFFKGQG